MSTPWPEPDEALELQRGNAYRAFMIASVEQYGRPRVQRSKVVAMDRCTREARLVYNTETEFIKVYGEVYTNEKELNEALKGLYKKYPSVHVRQLVNEILTFVRYAKTFRR